MEAPSYPSSPTSYLELKIELRVDPFDELGMVDALALLPDGRVESSKFPILDLPERAEVDAIAGLAILRGFTSDPVVLMREVGRRLYRASLGGTLRRHFVELSERSLRSGEPVAIRIAADDPRLVSQPWELLVDDWSKRSKDFFVLGGWPVIRAHLGSSPTPYPLQAQPRVRVLALIAHLPGLPLDRDLSVLREIAGTGAIELEELRISPGTPVDLVLTGVREADPEVVHYAGTGVQDHHPITDGKPSAPAVLVSNEKTLRAADLVAALAPAGRLRLVVFNAGLSDLMAAEVAGNVPAVLGFRGRPRGDACLVFARGLYQAIAAGASVRTAVLAGRQQVQYRFPQDSFWSLPVHWDRGDSTLVAYTSEGDDQAFEVEHAEEGVALLLEQRALLRRNLDVVRRRLKASSAPPLPTLAEQEQRLLQRVADLDRQISQGNA